MPPFLLRHDNVSRGSTFRTRLWTQQSGCRFQSGGGVGLALRRQREKADAECRQWRLRL